MIIAPYSSNDVVYPRFVGTHQLGALHLREPARQRIYVFDHP
jgi:hypothetical protein